jgi:aspartate/methionine/tyrosine aminotransferase
MAQYRPTEPIKDEGFTMSLWWKKLLIATGIARLLPSVRKWLQGGEEYLHYFSDRVLSFPRKDIPSDLFSAPLDSDVIHLAQSIPSLNIAFPTFRASSSSNHLDLLGLAKLRHFLPSESKTTQNEILITHGATGALGVLLDTFINPGDSIVLFDPTSPIYSLGAKHRRASIRWVPTRTEEGILRFDADSFRKSMRGAKVLLFCDPNNPTSGVFAQEDLEQVAFWARKLDVLIAYDETFANFRSTLPTQFASLPHCQNRILQIGSMSVTYGLPQLRIGWIKGNRHLVQACMVTQSLSNWIPSLILQEMAYQVMENSSEKLQSISLDFANRRGYVLERLQQMGLNPIPSNSGYFVWIPIGSMSNSSQELVKILHDQARILVNIGDSFGPSGKNFIRLSFGASEGRVREGLNRFARWLHPNKIPTESVRPTKLPEEVGVS